MVDWSLKDLADPKKYQEDLDVSNYDKKFLTKLLYSILLIRHTEDKLAWGRKQELIGGPVHLGSGQEAVAVGICENLCSEDRIFGAHRSHSHILALDPCFYELFAEVLGKNTGLSKGMGGSMHITNPDIGFYGSVPIVAGTVSLAVGASFDAQRNNNDSIGVAFLGDGAMEEGVVHESLNLARILETPTLFVVENNLFSSHMHLSLRQPKLSTARFAHANDIEFEIVDGNNVIEVFEKSKILIEKCRNGEGPKFIEALTYRHYGHVDWRKDIDVGVNRSEKDLSDWLKRDPLKKLINGMKNLGLIVNKELEELEKEICDEIDQAWKKAINDPFPNKEELLKRVYFTDEN